jgi:hypothetical protein
MLSLRRPSADRPPDIESLLWCRVCHHVPVLHPPCDPARFGLRHGGDLPSDRDPREPWQVPCPRLKRREQIRRRRGGKRAASRRPAIVCSATWRADKSSPAWRCNRETAGGDRAPAATDRDVVARRWRHIGRGRAVRALRPRGRRPDRGSRRAARADPPEQGRPAGCPVSTAARSAGPL